MKHKVLCWILLVTLPVFSRWTIWKYFRRWSKTMAFVCRLYWQCRKVCLPSFVVGSRVRECEGRNISSRQSNLLTFYAAFLILPRHFTLPISFHWHLLEILWRYFSFSIWLYITNSDLLFWTWLVPPLETVV